MSEKAFIYHIALQEDLAEYTPDIDYRCHSLTSEGFIHCCDRHQLHGVVNRYYQTVDEVMLMILDVDKLVAPLIHENTVGGSELFPHVYGPINAEAVVQILPFGIHSVERQGLIA